jgi:hypothetical protein
MAKTFYGYQERDPSKSIDWNEITRDINKRLTEESTRREELKAELDADTRSLVTDLNDAPMSQSNTLNQWLIGGVSNMMDLTLSLNKELKAGRLKPMDFTARMQSLKDGYGNIEGLASQWGQIYDKKLERLKTGDSAHLERELMEMTEGLINFNNTGIFTNPDGKVFIAKKEQDANGEFTGQLKKGLGDVVDLNVLRGMTSFTADRYDMEKDMNSMAEGFAKKWIRENGRITTDDIRDNPEFDKAVTTLINGRLANSITAGSDVLMETGQYSFTQDAAAAAKDPNAILLETDENGMPIPKLTDKQTEDAATMMREVLSTRLQSSVTEDEPVYRAPRQPTAAEVKARIDAQNDADNALMLLEVLQRAKNLSPTDPGFVNVESEIRGMLEAALPKGQTLGSYSITKIPSSSSPAGELVIEYTIDETIWDGEQKRHIIVPKKKAPIRISLGDDIGDIAAAFSPYVGIDVKRSDFNEQVRNLDDVEAYQFERPEIDPEQYSALRNRLSNKSMNSNNRPQTLGLIQSMLDELVASGVPQARGLKAIERGNDIIITDSNGTQLYEFKYGSSNQGQQGQRAVEFDRLLEELQSGGDFRYAPGVGGAPPNPDGQAAGGFAARFNPNPK